MGVRSFHQEFSYIELGRGRFQEGDDDVELNSFKAFHGLRRGA